MRSSGWQGLSEKCLINELKLLLFRGRNSRATKAIKGLNTKREAPRLAGKWDNPHLNWVRSAFPPSKSSLFCTLYASGFFFLTLSSLFSEIRSPKGNIRPIFPNKGRQETRGNQCRPRNLILKELLFFVRVLPNRMVRTVEPNDFHCDRCTPQSLEFFVGLLRRKETIASFTAPCPILSLQAPARYLPQMSSKSLSPEVDRGINISHEGGHIFGSWYKGHRGFKWRGSKNCTKGIVGNFMHFMHLLLLWCPYKMEKRLWSTSSLPTLRQIPGQCRSRRFLRRTRDSDRFRWGRGRNAARHYFSRVSVNRDPEGQRKILSKNKGQRKDTIDSRS